MTSPKEIGPETIQSLTYIYRYQSANRHSIDLDSENILTNPSIGRKSSAEGDLSAELFLPSC